MLKSLVLSQTSKCWHPACLVLCSSCPSGVLLGLADHGEPILHILKAGKQPLGGERFLLDLWNVRTREKKIMVLKLILGY